MVSPSNQLFEALRPLFSSRVFIRIVSCFGLLMAAQTALLAFAYGTLGFASPAAGLLTKGAFVFSAGLLGLATACFVRANLRLWQSATGLAQIATDQVASPGAVTEIAQGLAVYFRTLVWGIVASLVGGLVVIAAALLSLFNMGLPSS
ncbi:hypothetical protein C7271_18905 [filamentous cyanobacterium CCP5]|nr:hypothetical protein C7271_18905 [filamentous cyanobacterium CCP5]